MSGDCAGATAVVIGASQGIGLEISRALGKAGVRLLVAGSHPARLEATVETLRRAGFAVSGAVTDAGDASALGRLHRAAWETLGPADILVNSAATRLYSAGLDVTVEEWDRLMAVNLRGLFLACQLFGRDMVARGRGKILNVSSVLAFRAAANRAPYAASKAAVSALTRCLALEWAPHNVQVNAIAPGLVLSPPVEAAWQRDPTTMEGFERRIPAGRAASPREIAGLAVFLCSAEADYVTGQTYVIDGGLTLA